MIEAPRYAPCGRVYRNCSRCGQESTAPRCAWPTFPEMTPADPSGLTPGGMDFICTPCLQVEHFEATGVLVDEYGAPLGQRSPTDRKAT